jgi:hypothetical protein
MGIHHGSSNLASERVEKQKGNLATSKMKAHWQRLGAKVTTLRELTGNDANHSESKLSSSVFGHVNTAWVLVWTSLTVVTIQQVCLYTWPIFISGRFLPALLIYFRFGCKWEHSLNI